MEWLWSNPHSKSSDQEREPADILIDMTNLSCRNMDLIPCCCIMQSGTYVQYSSTTWGASSRSSLLKILECFVTHCECANWINVHDCMRIIGNISVLRWFELNPLQQLETLLFLKPGSDFLLTQGGMCKRTVPVRNPLGDRSSGETRKLPAAALIRISSLPKCLKVDSTTLIASSCLRTSPSNPTAYEVISKGTHRRVEKKNEFKAFQLE